MTMTPLFATKSLIAFNSESNLIEKVLGLEPEPGLDAGVGPAISLEEQAVVKQATQTPAKLPVSVFIKSFLFIGKKNF
jgi:hypothetical protein